MDITVSVPIQHSNNGFTAYKEVEVVVLKGSNGPVGNTSVSHSFTYHPPKKELIDEFLLMESGVNACINAGELVNRKLLELMTKVNKSFVYGVIETDYKRVSAKPIEQLDFMGLRDEFSELLKKSSIVRDKLRITSNSAIKPVTSTLHRFITDRNTYTHGKLAYEEIDKVFVIQSKDPVSKALHFSNINPDILQSFLSSTEPLVRLINDIKALYPDNPPS